MVWARERDHDTGRMWVDGQTESVMEAHGSNEGKAWREESVRPALAEGSYRALTPSQPDGAHTEVRHCRTSADLPTVC